MFGNLLIPMLFLILTAGEVDKYDPSGAAIGVSIYSNTLKGDVKSLFSSLLTLTPYSLLNGSSHDLTS